MEPEVLAVPVVDQPKKRSYRGEMTDERREKSSQAVRLRWETNKKKYRNRDKQIAHDYEVEWMSILEIATKYKIGKFVVSNILQDQGVEIRPRGVTKNVVYFKENIATIALEYTENKKSIGQLSLKYGVSERTVQRALKDHGVELRGRWPATKYSFN